jgi:hypothetical protein
MTNLSLSEGEKHVFCKGSSGMQLRIRGELLGRCNSAIAAVPEECVKKFSLYFLGKEGAKEWS